MPCSHCGQTVEPGSRFCPHCGALMQAAAEPVGGGAASTPPYAGSSQGQSGGYAPARPRLERPRSGRMIAGVCAAFANAYGWNVVLIRVLLVVLTPLHLGLGFLAYVVGWIVIPEAPWSVPSQGRP